MFFFFKKCGALISEMSWDLPLQKHNTNSQKRKKDNMEAVDQQQQRQKRKDSSTAQQELELPNLMEIENQLQQTLKSGLNQKEAIQFLESSSQEDDDFDQTEDNNINRN